MESTQVSRSPPRSPSPSTPRTPRQIAELRTMALTSMAAVLPPEVEQLEPLKHYGQHQCGVKMTIIPIIVSKDTPLADLPVPRTPIPTSPLQRPPFSPIPPLARPSVVQRQPAAMASPAPVAAAAVPALAPVPPVLAPIAVPAPVMSPTPAKPIAAKPLLDDYIKGKIVARYAYKNAIMLVLVQVGTDLALVDPVPGMAARDGVLTPIVSAGEGRANVYALCTTKQISNFVLIDNARLNIIRRIGENEAQELKYTFPGEHKSDMFPNAYPMFTFDEAMRPDFECRVHWANANFREIKAAEMNKKAQQNVWVISEELKKLYDMLCKTSDSRVLGKILNMEESIIAQLRSLSPQPMQ